MSGNTRPLAVTEKGLKHGVGNGVFCEHSINLFDAEIDFIQAFAQHLDFLREALKLCPVNHVRRSRESLGVEEAPAEVVSCWGASEQ